MLYFKRAIDSDIFHATIAHDSVGDSLSKSGQILFVFFACLCVYLYFFTWFVLFHLYCFYIFIIFWIFVIFSIEVWVSWCYLREKLHTQAWVYTHDRIVGSHCDLCFVRWFDTRPTPKLYSLGSTTILKAFVTARYFHLNMWLWEAFSGTTILKTRTYML